MSDEVLSPERIPKPLSAPFEAHRERIMARLQEAFGDGRMNLEEFDERMELARTATTAKELDVLVIDIPEPDHLPVLASASAGEPDPDSPGSPTSTALVLHREPKGSFVAIFGGSTQKGSWTPPQRIRAKAIFGGVDLDFRDAQLAPGSITEVECLALFGGVDIVVPEGVRVESRGHGIFGGFDNRNHDSGDEHAPVIRVHGSAIFGGVDVKVKKPRKKKKKR